MNENLSKVVIVGRTNVGKSTLFNRIVGSKESIVFDRDGVTRDYIEHEVSWNKKEFLLIDTGGILFGKNFHKEELGCSDLIDQEVQKQIYTLLENSSVIVFVCDGKVGTTQYDISFARKLHKIGKKILLVINKSDNKDIALESNIDFMRLGFKDVINVSAIHGIGVDELLDSIADIVPFENIGCDQKPAYNISIIGKPNVGKSSLMNLLIQENRSIVSNVPGTTRESISKNIFHCDDLIQITDTAGTRRKSRVHDDLETLMVKSSLSSIRTADIVILMVDASSSRLSDQEIKLLFYCFEQYKPVVILFNKYDLLKNNDYCRDRLLMSIEEYKFVLKKVSKVNISCLTKKNVYKVLDTVSDVIKRATQFFETDDVNEIMKNAFIKSPLYHKGTKLKLFKIRYVKKNIPTFVLHVNYPEWFGPTQLGFVENVLRRNYPLESCPVVFNLKKV